MMGRPKPTPERTVTPAKASVFRILDFETPIREQPGSFATASAKAGFLPFLNTSKADIGSLGFPQQLRQLGDIHGDAAGFVAGVGVRTSSHELVLCGHGA